MINKNSKKKKKEKTCDQPQQDMQPQGEDQISYWLQRGGIEQRSMQRNHAELRKNNKPEVVVEREHREPNDLMEHNELSWRW